MIKNTWLRLEYEPATKQLNIYSDQGEKSCAESRSDWQLLRSLPMERLLESLQKLVEHPQPANTVIVEL